MGPYLWPVPLVPGSLPRCQHQLLSCCRTAVEDQTVTRPQETSGVGRAQWGTVSCRCSWDAPTHVTSSWVQGGHRVTLISAWVQGGHWEIVTSAWTSEGVAGCQGRVACVWVTASLQGTVTSSWKCPMVGVTHRAGPVSECQCQVGSRKVEAGSHLHSFHTRRNT